MITGDAPLTALAVARMLNIGASVDNVSNKVSQTTKIFEDVSEASSSISDILSSLKHADGSKKTTLGCVTGRFLEAFPQFLASLRVPFDFWAMMLLVVGRSFV
jgi:magnesium-transporting ATPase (P-type)